MRIYFFLMVFTTASCFHFTVRKWGIGDSRENIDHLTTDNGNIFLSRNKEMQWFRPLSNDRPIVHLSRDFPRTINRLSVSKKALLVNMLPNSHDYVSETMVFAKDKSYSVLWRDTTMYETVIEKNGYVLRSNYFGNITYGDYKNIFTYNTKKYINSTYTAMFVHDKYLWCATQCSKNYTKIDVFNLYVEKDGNDYISTIPDMSFLIENKGCSHPFKMWVSIENDHPKQIVYIVLGYMTGGVNVAQCYYPPEKNYTRMLCSHLPNQHPIRSISLDFPYLFFLDEEGISAYRLFARVDVQQYRGKHKIFKDYYQEVSHIVSIKKKVFWNGGQTLYSAEMVD